MTFLEEIAQRIDKALDGDCGYGVGKHLAEQLSPLIAEHDAALIEELADEVNVKRNEPGLVHLDVRYAGYYTGIRSGLESSETLLREKARQRREEQA